MDNNLGSEGGVRSFQRETPGVGTFTSHQSKTSIRGFVPTGGTFFFFFFLLKKSSQAKAFASLVTLAWFSLFFATGCVQSILGVPFV